MAISEKKLAANRANARRSTGPRTAAGKAKVARNALVHGLTARAPLLPHDDAAAFTRFAKRLIGELRPDGAMQEELAGEIVNLSWKMRRAQDAETQLLVRHHGVWNASRDVHLGEPPGKPDIPEEKGDTEYGVWFHQSSQVLCNMAEGNPPNFGGASPVWNLQRYATHLERARASSIRMLLALQKRKPVEEDRYDEDEGDEDEEDDEGATNRDGAVEDVPNAERADAEQRCQEPGADKQDAPADDAPVQNKPTDPPAGGAAQATANSTDVVFIAPVADDGLGESKAIAGASPPAARGSVREGG